jgi:antitoxin (DNA-binding transcriptional repressor) of toxin-antitoxin stability system
MARTVTVEEIEKVFPDFLAQIKAGETEIIVAQDGKPVVRLTAAEVPKNAKRVPGSAAGQVVLAPDFFAPLPDDILEAWQG